MSLQNTSSRYGTVTKSFHWLTALLILTIIPLGIIAENMAHSLKLAEGAPDPSLITRTAFLFSMHKTLGVTVFFVALARILWALGQTKPGLLNGDKAAESFAAETVHWLLYGSLVMVPLSGWIHHASTTGFAPIWWPFGQSLPFVPKDELWAAFSGTTHYLLQWVLIGSLGLHIAGALKHHVLDKDATLRRMLPGRTEGQPTTQQPGHFAPLLGALAVWALVLGGAASQGWYTPHSPETAGTQASLTAEGGNWQVQDGTLEITVRQMGSDITGQFADWSASIQYVDTPDADGKYGEVLVDINTASLSLGSVTSQATGPGYLESATHSLASFRGDIVMKDNNLMASGTLTIRDQSVPLDLPFELAIEEQTAQASGAAQVNRLDFGIGQDVKDEGSLGFGVAISFALTATQKAP